MKLYFLARENACSYKKGPSYQKKKKKKKGPWHGQNSSYEFLSQSIHIGSCKIANGTC